ncbi:ParB family chromosome partitioning protein [Limimaricola soesokkakensis]|uniref:Chromosome-partitioning protein ParB n=1 Tax=Limimaricola soesokkakensis TaxID=1343159 RepID=A0A1X7A6F6_9RHOB|nr:plasmid partitioning protein RepB [Limimaricola soesokkakensis]PSK80531.1 ParB family chromosome partitioning protein [Limimaricola soesokkakensis]SLN71284.1 Chromosome-partitioning protein ParB [Limimaricola soesokkakensis]
MSENRKKRMSMLDGLAAVGSQPGAPMMSSNRALRSARDAVDSHRVWELDPAQVDDTRTRDRLDPSDVIDLRKAIEANGQAVPILVRRHPEKDGRYLLVYGRRRLEAVRTSEKVGKVRALIAQMDERGAVTAQISENMARRDLSFIEKALFAQELVESGFGNQRQVAEVLTTAKSAVSMSISVAETIGRDLATAIGPAHGIGRPRWEAMARAIETSAADRAELAELADDVHTAAQVAITRGTHANEDPSVAAFEAVMERLTPSIPPAAPPAPRRASTPAPTRRPLQIDGRKGGTLRRTAKGLDLQLEDQGFADWLESEAQQVFEELHARWTARDKS